MDVNANDIEKTYSVMSTGLTSYVFSILGQMTNEIKALREENDRLNQRIKDLQPEPTLANK
jgi:hypothetical protein